jgi:MFS family permease
MSLRMSERRTSMLGALLATLGPISMSIYTPAMPELVQAFATTESMIKLTLSVYFGGFSVAQLIAGPMSDAFGRRKATLAFVGINLLGSLVCAFAPTVDWLLAGRLIQGIGASVGITVARAIVRDQFTGAEASRIMNLIGIMLAIGPAMAPTIGGLALVVFGWQAIFFVLAGFGLIAITAVIVFMRETTVPDRRRAGRGPLLSGLWRTDPRSTLCRRRHRARRLGGCALCAIDHAVLHPDRHGRHDPDRLRHRHADAERLLFFRLGLSQADGGETRRRKGRFGSGFFCVPPVAC